MTTKELQKLVEEIGVKLNTLATIQNTIATLVHEGMRQQLEQSQMLLEAIRNHEQRLERLEGGETHG